MASRASKNTAGAPNAPSPAPSAFVAAGKPPASVSLQKPIRGYAPPFVLMAKADCLEITGGEVLPSIARIEAVPGRGGNGPGDSSDPSGACASMERQGFRRIPDDLAFECWGETQTNAKPSACAYRDWYESDRVGGIWSETWSRPRVVLGATRWAHDPDGKRNFQRAVLRWLTGADTVDPEIVAEVSRPALDVAMQYLSQAQRHPQSRLHLVELVAQIPRSVLPEDLLPYAPDEGQE